MARPTLITDEFKERVRALVIGGIADEMIAIELRCTARTISTVRKMLHIRARDLKKKSPDSDKPGIATLPEAGSSNQNHVTTASATLSESA